MKKGAAMVAVECWSSSVDSSAAVAVKEPTDTKLLAAFSIVAALLATASLKGILVKKPDLLDTNSAKVEATCIAITDFPD